MERTRAGTGRVSAEIAQRLLLKVAESYRATVLPLLKIKEEVIAEGGLNDPKPEEKKKKGRFLGIFPKP